MALPVMYCRQDIFLKPLVLSTLSANTQACAFTLGRARRASRPVHKATCLEQRESKLLDHKLKVAREKPPGWLIWQLVLTRPIAPARRPHASRGTLSIVGAPL